MTTQTVQNHVLGAASKDRSITSTSQITPDMFDDALRRLERVSGTLAKSRDYDLAIRSDLALRQILADLGITVEVK